MGAGTSTRGRTHDDRPRVGPDRPGQGARKGRCAQVVELEGGLGADKGLNPADASATKVYGTELALEIYRLLLDIVGQAGYLVEGSPGAVVRGRLENQARSQTIFTFGGGTNEIQRDIIAMIGLGMPRAPR